MAEIGNYPSGLTEAELQSRLAALKSDWRLQECAAAMAAGKRADIGLFVQSKRSFFDPDGKPLVAGFEPASIRDLDDLEGPPLSRELAVTKQSSAAGFVAGWSVDLQKVGDVDTFLGNLLAECGPVEFAPQFFPNLTRSVSFIAADPASQQRVSPGVAQDGSGTTVCVVDMGCDFAHRNFRTPDTAMNTRLKFLAVMDSSSAFTKHATATIDGWLQRADPYKDPSTAAPVQYDPHDAVYNCLPVEAGEGTHGTMVLDIAAGNGSGTGVPGVAPKADLCFVQPYVSITNDRRYISGDTLYNAIAYALTELGPGAPVVVSVSLGTNDGPHDNVDYGGGTFWNVLTDALFGTTKGRALVWSAGNQGQGDAHATGRVRKGTINSASFDVRIAKSDKFGSELKIWFEKPVSETVSVQVRLQQYNGRAEDYEPIWQTTSPFEDEDGRVAGTFGTATRYGSAGSKLYFISCTLRPYSTRGGPAMPRRWETWRFEVQATSVAPIALHAWIIDDARDSTRFLASKPAMRTQLEAKCSLSACAAGLGNATIVGAVTSGGYIAGRPVHSAGQGDPMGFSSYGPTRTGGQRPDVSAPGDIVRGARSKADPIGSRTGYGDVGLTTLSGTSMAAPHVAGLVALYFSKLKASGAAFPASFPTSDDMRLKLRSAARPANAGGAASWDNQRGCGVVDATLLLK